MKKEFTKKELASSLGITPRTIQYYTDEGIIVPEIENPKGRGKTRIYSARNLVQFLIVRTLTEYGLTLAKVKKIMSYIMEVYKKDPRIAYGWNPEALIPDKTPFHIYLYDLETDHWGVSFGFGGKWRKPDIDSPKETRISRMNVKFAIPTRPSILEVDMEGTQSVLIINVSILAEKILAK